MSRFCAWLMVVLLSVSGTALLHAQETSSPVSIDPKALEMLREVSETILGADTISFKVMSDVAMSFEGDDHNTSGLFEAKVERPDKIALICNEGPLAGVTVSNGTTLTVYMESVNGYVQEAYTDLRKEYVAGKFPMAIPGLDKYFAKDPLGVMMEGVTSATFHGTVSLDGVEVEHATFFQEDMEWQAWIDHATTGSVLRKVIFTTASSEFDGDAEDESGSEMNLQMRITLEYSDWQFDRPIPASTFEYTPPSGAQDMRTRASAEEVGEKFTESNPLLGKPAPEFTLDLFGGGTVSTSEMTSQVVVLDFWASWCGPCRVGLPILDKVAEEFSDRPVRFYAVNLEESTGTIQKFVDAQKLKMPVALDRDTAVGQAFNVSSIPATYVIGMDGTVQAVHIGTSPDAEEKLTKEIESLLRGEILATTPTAAARDGDGELTDSAVPGADVPELEEIWALPGQWIAAEYDSVSQTILAVRARGTVAVVDTDGTKRSDFTIRKDVSQLRLAQLDGSSERELLVFRGWGDSVTAYSTTGTKLWEHKGGQGVNDVWAGNLSGGSTEDVVVGYNGGTGIHILKSTGEVIQQIRGIGNVWHVCVANVTGDEVPEVVSTSARGQIHIFDAAGKKLKDIRPKLYANMVRVAIQTDKTIILAGGSGDRNESMEAYDFEGKQMWNTVLGTESSHIDSAAVSPDGSMVAVGLRGGSLLVLSTGTGEIIGKAEGLQEMPQVGWADQSGKQLLLVPFDKELKAFIVPKSGEN